MLEGHNNEIIYFKRKLIALLIILNLQLKTFNQQAFKRQE